MGIVTTGLKYGAKLGRKMFKKTGTLGTGKYTSKIPTFAPTKTGIAVMAGTGFIGSIGNAADQIQERTLGNVDNNIQSATPFIDNQKDYRMKGSSVTDTGVDGSLAFALHRNRFS